MTDRVLYVLHLRSEPGQLAPEANRMRSLLKACLRTFGFRCTRIEYRPDPDGAAASQAKEVATDARD